MKETLYNLIQSQGEGAVTITDVAINLIAALLIGALIYIAYRATHSGTVYSERFNISLVMVTLVTTMVMCVIGNNISLSLGMVGALSIVRFRTAIKDPRDTIYIFWSVAVGICCGVSDYLIALMGSVVIFLFLILFGFVRNTDRTLIIVRGGAGSLVEAEKTLQLVLEQRAVRRVHNVDFGADGESIFETSSLYLKKCEKKNGSLEEKLNGIEGINSISIVCQDDEISG